MFLQEMHSVFSCNPEEAFKYRQVAVAVFPVKASVDRCVKCDVVNL